MKLTVLASMKYPCMYMSREVGMTPPGKRMTARNAAGAFSHVRTGWPAEFLLLSVCIFTLWRPRNLS